MQIVKAVGVALFLIAFAISAQEPASTAAPADSVGAAKMAKPTSPSAADTAGQVLGSPTGALRILTAPESTTVSIDDSVVGLSPVAISGITPGSHVVKLSKKGYFLKKATIVVEAGAGQELSFTLTSPVTLVVTGAPTGAAVLLDGKEVGVIPFTDQKLKPGAYTIMVQQAGYQSVTRQISLADGGRDSLDIQLVKQALIQEKAAAPADTAAAKPVDSRKPMLNRITLGLFIAFSLVLVILELANSSK
jgi:hypothetical protein